MNVKKIKITVNDTGKKKDKRLIAHIFDDQGGEKTVYFGKSGSGGTYFDGAMDGKRKDYVNAHGKMGEDWNGSGVLSAGFYSRWVLWESRKKSEISSMLKQKTGAKIVTLSFPKIKVTRPN
jgi:hypothetical protein